jgi:hypothetical protein
MRLLQAKQAAAVPNSFISKITTKLIYQRSALKSSKRL